MIHEKAFYINICINKKSNIIILYIFIYIYIYIYIYYDNYYKYILSQLINIIYNLKCRL